MFTSYTDTHKCLPVIQIYTNIYQLYRYIPMFTSYTDTHKYLPVIQIYTNVYQLYRYIPGLPVIQAACQDPQKTLQTSIPLDLLTQYGSHTLISTGCSG